MTPIATCTEQDLTRTLLQIRDLKNGRTQYLIHTNIGDKRHSLVILENDTNTNIDSAMRGIGAIDIGRIAWRADRGQTCPVEFTIDAVREATKNAPGNRLTVTA